MDKMTDQEVTSCRSALGKLNWVATQTRPDLSCDVSELSSLLHERKASLMPKINKVIRKAKKEPSQISIPCMSDLDKCKLVGFSDASFAIVSGTKSQGGYIIYVTDETNNFFPIVWQSQKVKRVVKSTHAAETLALVDAAEACVFFQNFLRALIRTKEEWFPIICKTDSAALHASVYASTQILDKRLRIETAILREMLSKNELSAVEWVPTSEQCADALTKSGVISGKILKPSSVL